MQHPVFPHVLHLLASISVASGLVCAAVIALDEWRHPQPMGVMNLVWPLTALFGSVLWLAAYFCWGRATDDHAGKPRKTPWPIAVFKGSSHCGAGCALGDLIAEWAAFFMPAIAVWFGWHRLFVEKMFAVWIVDFIVAFLLGVAFQYFTIKPMRKLSVMQGIVQALKADTASITSWQVGMYGVMALIQFGWFRARFGGLAPVDSAEFWFAMQLAMLAGFVTSYPVNWWLLRADVKERM